MRQFNRIHPPIRFEYGFAKISEREGSIFAKPQPIMIYQAD